MCWRSFGAICAGLMPAGTSLDGGLYVPIWNIYFFALCRKHRPGNATAARILLDPLPKPHRLQHNGRYPVRDAAKRRSIGSRSGGQSFGTARRFSDYEVLVIGIGMVPDRHYRVRIGKAREWQRMRRSEVATDL
jgi:hypothetical protein